MNQNRSVKTEKASGLPSLADSLYSFIRRHPYIVLGIFCVLFGFSTGCASESINFFALIAALPAAAVLSVICRGYFSLKKKGTAAACVISLAVIVLSAVLIKYIPIGYQIVRMTMLMSVSVCMLILWKKGKLGIREMLFIVVVFGIALRMIAVTELNIVFDQHDVNLFSKSADTVYNYQNGQLIDMSEQGAGHAGYIEYFFHYYHLPDFDMRNVWSFYNPPLHHIISAIWLRVGVLIFDYQTACENLQSLTLFYSCAILLMSVRLFKFLGTGKTGSLIAVSIVSFNNALILFSININNDPLAAFLSFTALFLALKWYRNRSFINILKIAAALGFAMMTKLSSATAAFPIAFIFAAALTDDIRRKQKPLKCLGQFAAFLGVCAPLGLFYQVRNYILFGIPLTYVQTVQSEESILATQYVGHIPVWKRLFDFSPGFLNPPWMHTLASFGFDRYPENEYNPLIALIKTALFEEYRQNVLNVPAFDIIAVILLLAAIILSIASMITMIRSVIVSKGESRIFHIFMAVAFFSMMISFYAFCFSYPYACSQHIRYIPLVIVIVGYYSGVLFEAVPKLPLKELRKGQLQDKKKLAGTITGAAVCLLTAVLACGQIFIF